MVVIEQKSFKQIRREREGKTEPKKSTGGAGAYFETGVPGKIGYASGSVSRIETNEGEVVYQRGRGTGGGTPVQPITTTPANSKEAEKKEETTTPGAIPEKPAAKVTVSKELWMEYGPTLTYGSQEYFMTPGYRMRPPVKPPEGPVTLEVQRGQKPISFEGRPFYREMASEPKERGVKESAGPGLKRLVTIPATGFVRGMQWAITEPKNRKALRERELKTQSVLSPFGEAKIGAYTLSEREATAKYKYTSPYQNLYMDPYVQSAGIVTGGALIAAAGPLPAFIVRSTAGVTGAVMGVRGYATGNYEEMWEGIGLTALSAPWEKVPLRMGLRGYETIAGEKWTGLGIEWKTKGAPLIGWVEGKGPRIGTPTFEGIPSEGPPSSPTETAIFSSTVERSFPERYATRYEYGLKLGRAIETTQSPFKPYKFPEETFTLGSKGVKTVLTFAEEEGATAYGSFGAAAQSIPPLVKEPVSAYEYAGELVRTGEIKGVYREPNLVINEEALGLYYPERPAYIFLEKTLPKTKIEAIQKFEAEGILTSIQEERILAHELIHHEISMKTRGVGLGIIEEPLAYGGELAWETGIFNFKLEKPLFEEPRTSVDIDVKLPIEAGTPSFEAKRLKLVEALKKAGEDVRPSPTSPGLIEKRIGGDWYHAVDIHGIGEEGISPGITGEKVYGLKLGQPTVNVEGVKTMPLSEHWIRKFGSSLTPKTTEEGKPSFAPEAHRGKDVRDMFSSAEVLIRGKKASKQAELFGWLEEMRGTYPKGSTEGGTTKIKLFEPKEIPERIKGGIGFRPSPSPSIGTPSKGPSITISPSISTSTSISPSISPSVSVSVSPSISPSISPSVGPSISPSIVSPSPSPPSPGSPSPPPPSQYKSPSQYYTSPSPSISPSPSPSPSPSIGIPPSPPSRPPMRFTRDIGIPTPKKFYKGAKQPKEYKPSIYAIGFGIKGKPSKAGIITGLGIRPIPVTTKTKKKKRR